MEVHTVMGIVITVIRLNVWTPKIINFPFETNGKLTISGASILKHIKGKSEF